MFILTQCASAWFETQALTGIQILSLVTWSALARTMQSHRESIVYLKSLFKPLLTLVCLVLCNLSQQHHRECPSCNWNIEYKKNIPSPFILASDNLRNILKLYTELLALFLKMTFQSHIQHLEGWGGLGLG